LTPGEAIHFLDLVEQDQREDPTDAGDGAQEPKSHGAGSFDPRAVKKLMKFHCPTALTFLIFSLSACSSDRAPSDAIEAPLSVVMTLGAFDPDFGRTGETIVFVTIDGEDLRLEADEGSTVIGFEAIERLTELNGRRVLVAGEKEGGIYRASYTRLLPGGGNDDPDRNLDKVPAKRIASLWRSTVAVNTTNWGRCRPCIAEVDFRCRKIHEASRHNMTPELRALTVVSAGILAAFL
jgi:hypothetical protein